jgi:hypothetical protein
MVLVSKGNVVWDHVHLKIRISSVAWGWRDVTEAKISTSVSSAAHRMAAIREGLASSGLPPAC